MKKRGNEIVNEESQTIKWHELKVRLDAIVLLLMKSKFADEEGNVRISEGAPLLHAAGYTPTEIAEFFGKKKATEVAPYLYSKRKISRKK